MMKVFDSVLKKLAIPVFVLFAVGWVVFTAGFGLVINETVEALASATTSRFSADNPFYFPYYFTLAGGPFVVVLGLVHAALPSNLRLAGAIIGVLSTILNNIYFISVGFVLSYGHLLIQLLITEEKYFNIMFAGAILLTVSWSVSQILVVFFQQPQQTQRRNWWVLTVDIFTRNQVGGHRLSCTEVIRLLSIPAVVVSIIGWSVYVGGLHNFLQDLTTGNRIINFINNFAFWGSVTITPFGFLIALLQAGSSGNETIFGSLVSILNSFIIVCVGYVVTYIGQILSLLQDDGGSDTFNINNINLIFGGGIIFLLFWTVILAMSRFYDTHSIRTTGSTSNQLQLLAAPLQHATTLNNSATVPQSELQLTVEPPPAYDFKQPSIVQQEN